MCATVPNHRQSVWTKVKILLPLSILVLEGATLAMTNIGGTHHTGQGDAITSAGERQVRLWGAETDFRLILLEHFSLQIYLGLIASSSILCSMHSYWHHYLSDIQNHKLSLFNTGRVSDAAQCGQMPRLKHGCCERTSLAVPVGKTQLP